MCQSVSQCEIEFHSEVQLKILLQGLLTEVWAKSEMEATKDNQQWETCRPWA